jgi:hypothetical protein
VAAHSLPQWGWSFFAESDQNSALAVNQKSARSVPPGTLRRLPAPYPNIIGKISRLFRRQMAHSAEGNSSMRSRWRTDRDAGNVHGTNRLHCINAPRAASGTDACAADAGAIRRFRKSRP